MGYKYQNKLDKLNEDIYWQSRPKWQRQISIFIQFILSALVILLMLAGFCIPIWDVVVKWF